MRRNLVLSSFHWKDLWWRRTAPTSLKKSQQIEIIGFRFELGCKLEVFFGLFMAFHQSLFGGFLGHELGGLMSQSGHTR